jgi:hypothetical protein
MEAKKASRAPRKTKAKAAEPELPVPEPEGSLMNILSQASQEAVTEPIQETPVAETKPTRRGKKPIQVVAVVTANGIEGSFPQEQKRPLIGHLPISSASVSFNDETSVGNEVFAPEPFDDNYVGTIGAPYNDDKKVTASSQPAQTPNQQVSNTSTQPQTNVKVEKKTNVPSTISTTVPSFTQVQLFAEYLGARDQKTIPDKTDIACLWCCEQFSWKPVVIPCRYEADVMNGPIKGQYRVYGNFCSPECAMAHLLEEQIDTHARWERISWLHLIYGAAVGGRLYPAPSRMTLKKYGGVYTIEQFRDLAFSHKVRADIHYPPMVSLLATMDTKPIDFYEAQMKQALPSYAFEHKGDDEGLRLKRTKPLKERESTLDACIMVRSRE